MPRLYPTGAVRASSIFPILSVGLLFFGGLCVAASEFYKSKHNVILSAGIFFVSAGDGLWACWGAQRPGAGRGPQGQQHRGLSCGAVPGAGRKTHTVPMRVQHRTGCAGSALSSVKPAMLGSRWRGCCRLPAEQHHQGCSLLCAAPQHFHRLSYNNVFVSGNCSLLCFSSPHKETNYSPSSGWMEPLMQMRKQQKKHNRFIK